MAHSPLQLTLFDFGEEIDMARLKVERDRLSRWNRAHLTRKGYASDWHLFCEWCKRVASDPLPASNQTVELYLTWMLIDQGRKTTTAHRHASAISYFHRQAGFPNPVSPEAKLTITGARRERREQPQGKDAFTAPELRSMSAKLARNGSNQALRNRAIIVLGVASMLRRSELAALEIDDIVFDRRGVLVTLHHSKRDQAGKGCTLGILRGTHPDTCVVRVLRDWIKVRGKESGFLFRRIRSNDTVSDRGITGETIYNVVKSAVGLIGLQKQPYGAHSLRASGITVAADEGAGDREIMDRSRHKSIKVMRGYVRTQRVFPKHDPFRQAL
jgi:integrase